MADVFHIIYDDGSVEIQTLPDGVDPVLGKPGRVAGEVEYEQALALITEHNAIQTAELLAREQAVQKADYDALIATGVPEATARRLTGYTGS